MNVFDILRGVQDARTHVETWDISLKTVLIAGAVAFVIYLVTLREVLAWFLKINRVRRDIAEVKAELGEIRAMIKSNRS